MSARLKFPGIHGIGPGRPAGSVQPAWLTNLAKSKKEIKVILESNDRKIAELTKDLGPVQKPPNEPPNDAMH